MKIIENILVGLCAIGLIWCLISYGEIIIKNTSPNPQYSNLNIIVRMFDGDR